MQRPLCQTWISHGLINRTQANVLGYKAAITDEQLSRDISALQSVILYPKVSIVRKINKIQTLLTLKQQ